jgi:hypothetical protein
MSGPKTVAKDQIDEKSKSSNKEKLLLSLPWLVKEVRAALFLSISASFSSYQPQILALRFNQSIDKFHR